MNKLPAPPADTPTLDQLREALARAQADTPARWGKMDCPQMVKHCREFIDLYQGRAGVAAPMRWLVRWVGPFFLRRTLRKSPTQTPRNLATMPVIRAEEGEALDLEAERARLRAGLDEIEALSGTVDHPLYGPTDARDVVNLVRHHTAHHLNQFGLLRASEDTPAG